ncbi:serine hydrolase domain-containing protein [Qipengyuania seohaensis]|uniref:serine hydrolase domain-containing protein n=1 Tax=Qipengyuania seohaensis TaxID=266951 RepID=UPI0012FE2D2F|nr:serine hydrolase domain-containing protein [Qipengyuania seohaensis]
MRAVLAALAAVMLTGCPPPDGLVYSTSSPSASLLTKDRLQPIVDTYAFDGELRISGGPLDGAAMGRGNLWPWASVTKQMVATLVMQEVEHGRISLDVPVSRYLSEWPDSGPAAPSLRQLLRHQSGLYDPEDDAGFVIDPSTPLDPMVCVDRRTQAAGGDFNYTNCDTLIVGKVLERVTGLDLASLFAERIAEPSGMMEAGFVTAETQLAPSAKGTPASEIANYGASGALAGTTRDLIAFDRALMAGHLLSRSAREEMWDGVPELGYVALGQWESTLPLDGCAEPVRIIERRGAIGGYQARNFIIPERDIAIVTFIGQSEDDYSFGEPWSREGLSYELLSAAVCSI